MSGLRIPEEAMADKLLKALRKKVVEALRSAPYPYDDPKKSLLDLSIRVLMRPKAQHIEIVPLRSSFVSNSDRMRAALDAAGLRYRYSVESFATYMNVMGSVGVGCIRIPLDQETGPWGYEE